MGIIASFNSEMSTDLESKWPVQAKTGDDGSGGSWRCHVTSMLLLRIIPKRLYESGSRRPVPPPLSIFLLPRRMKQRRVRLVQVDFGPM